MPAFAGALVAAAYLVGGVVFSMTSQSGQAGAEPTGPARQAVAVSRLHDFSRLPDSNSPVPAELATPVEVSASAVIPVDAPETVLAIDDVPRIAIVIDDVGLDVDAARRTIALDGALSLAVLPYAEAAGVISQEAQARGHDVLLHMPMEPVGLADPGPNALRLGLSDADLAARMRWALAQVPGAVGINNHMGSRFTADPRAMRVALAAVAERDPLFLDSLTTGESRGRAVAEGLGLRALQRDIFLDHVISAAEVEARLAEAESLARTRGWAVVIGHPHAVTLDVLENWVIEAERRGVELVTLTELAAVQQLRTLPTADIAPEPASGLH
jgi:polysaccharide deacetylase 2 family uncharacterized protein YibQ